MTQPLTFAKLSGSGNDFVCVDNTDGRLDALLADPLRLGQFAKALCARGMGVGADGVIFASASDMGPLADVGARFLEPDGSEAELCGNGTACFTRWAIDSGWARGGELKILTPAGVVRGRPADGQYVRVCIPLPERMERGLEVAVGAQRFVCDFAVTGVPHLVVYVDDVNAIDMPHLGPALRYHERFAPRGVNVNFVQVLGEGRLAVRTWEFGVEGETLACGTGAATSAVMAARREHWPARYMSNEQPVLVQARGGDTLRIYASTESDGSVSDLCLDSVVRYIFAGTLHADMAKRAGL